MTIKIAIVEDNESDAATLTGFINRYLTEIGCQAVCDIFRSGLDFLDHYHKLYDVVFMDIELPNMNGLKTSERLREIDSEIPIVFVTNMAQCAADGYTVNALDFVIKPVTYYDFSLKMKRVVEFIRRREYISLRITVGDEIKILSSNDIVYVEIMAHDLIYHTTSGKYKTRGSIKNVYDILSDAGFYMCNRCYLVNLKYVTGVRDNTVQLLGAELFISRSRRKEFLAAIADYYACGGDDRRGNGTGG